MARMRSIKIDFFKDEDLTTLPFEHRLLFEGLLCLADREGRLEYRPKRIKVEIMPFDDVDIDAMCRRLADPNIPHRPGKRFIDIYESSGQLYIEICNFKKHQRPHHLEPKSKLPANTLKTDKTCQSTSDNGLKPDDNVLNPLGSWFLNNGNGNGNGACTPPVKMTHTTQNALELVCAVYPEAGLKIGLEDGAAAEAIDEIMPSEHGQVVIAAKNYAAEVAANGTAPQFVKQLANFLRCSADYPRGFWRNYVNVKPLGASGPSPPPGPNPILKDLEEAAARVKAERAQGIKRPPRPAGL